MKVADMVTWEGIGVCKMMARNGWKVNNVGGKRREREEGLMTT